MRFRHRVTTSEERDLVTLVDQLLSEVGYNPFGTTVILRRYALKKRCHLSNSHNNSKPQPCRPVQNFLALQSGQNHKRANQCPLVPPSALANNVGRPFIFA